MAGGSFRGAKAQVFEALNFATKLLYDVQSIDVTNHTSDKAEVASLQGVGTLTDGQAPSALNSATGPRPSRIEVNHSQPVQEERNRGKEAAAVDGLKKSSRQVPQSAMPWKCRIIH